LSNRDVEDLLAERGTNDISEWIEEFNQSINLPANLGEMGVTSDMIPDLSEHCMTDACHFSNPKIPTVEEYHKMFADAIG
jgi:alcohol dehydrogenase class IV